MTASILVAYATRYGSTHEVAEAVASAIRGHGLTADVKPVGDVACLDGYGAVVLGAPIYIGHLYGDFRAFLLRHRETLEKLPVAVFALGPLHDDPAEIAGSREALARELARLRWLKPVATQVFVGTYDPAHLGFLHRIMAAVPGTPLHDLPATDERDPAVTEAWADRLAITLEVAMED